METKDMNVINESGAPSSDTEDRGVQVKLPSKKQQQLLASRALSNPVKNSKSRRSLIPKRDAKTGSMERFTEETAISNPEVRNAVKDIIKLLKGLDKISGNPDTSEVGLDDVTATESQDVKADDDAEGLVGGVMNETSSIRSTTTTFQGLNDNIASSSPRPVRVSHVILKHEDPTFTKVTYETFDPDLETPSTSKNSKRVTHHLYEFRRKDSEVPVNNTEPKSSQSTRKKLTYLEQKNVLRATPASNKGLLPSLHRVPTRTKPTGGVSKDLESSKVRAGRSRSTPVAEKTSSGIEDRQFYTLKNNIVYREPNLNIFLPIEFREKPKEDALWNPRTGSRHDSVPPENFGAPYFRLDGSIQEDANPHLRSNPDNAEINRLVKKAVQEQQLMYMEAAENAKQYSRKLVHHDLGKDSNRKSKRRL